MKIQLIQKVKVLLISMVMLMMKSWLLHIEIMDLSEESEENKLELENE